MTTFWFHHIDNIEGLKPDIWSTSDLWNAVSFFVFFFGGGGDLFFLPQLTAESVKYSYTDAGNGISIRRKNKISFVMRKKFQRNS